MTEEKVRENRIRRVAERRGLQLHKSRRRDKDAIGYGGYMVTELGGNTVLMGAEGHEYSASLDEIEKALTEGWLKGRWDKAGKSVD